MPTADSRRIALLSTAACAGMFVFGIVIALLGAVLPVLADQLEFQVGDIGTLFLVMNGAMLAASLGLGVAMDRFGMKPPLAIGALLVALALLMVARATALADLQGAVVLLGLGGGALNGSTNTLIADLHDDPRRKSAALNVLGMFFGLGALLLPFAIGALLSRVSLPVLLLASAVPCALVGTLAAALVFPPPKHANRLPLGDVPRFLREPLVIVLAALLFFQSGVEFTLGGFISTYLTRALAVSVPFASWVLAAYWASIVTARLVLGRFGADVSPHRLLIVCACGALSGAIVEVFATSSALAVFGILMIGISLAGVFPAALGIAGARFQTHSGTVFGLLFSVALTGAMTLPWIAAQLAEAAGLRWIFVLVACSFAVTLALSRAAARLVVGARPKRMWV